MFGGIMFMTSLKKKLNALLKEEKIKKKFHHPTHIILFSATKNSPQEYALCFEEQIEKAFEFLRNENAHYVTVIQLGRNVLTYRSHE